MNDLLLPAAGVLAACALANHLGGGNGRAAGGTARPSFEEWMREVDRAVQARAGLSVHDLADANFADWYDDRVSPKSAAARAIRADRSGYAFGGKVGRYEVDGKRYVSLKRAAKAAAVQSVFTGGRPAVVDRRVGIQYDIRSGPGRKARRPRGGLELEPDFG